MRGKIVAAVVATFLVAWSGTSSAQGRISAGGEFGTLGFGVDGAFRVNDWLWLRGNANFGSFDLPEIMTSATSYGGIGYDFEADLMTVGVLADFYPLGTGSGLSFSAGVYHNGNEFALLASPQSSITVGGTTYTPAQIGTLRAETTFEEFAPYLGVGFENSFLIGLPVEFFARAGVLFQGSPSVTMTSTGSVTVTDLLAEANDLEDSLSNLEFYPVLSLGVLIRF